MKKHEIQATTVERIPTSGPIDVSFETSPRPPSPFAKMHRLLRGRYPLAIGLALLGLAGGAYLGWSSQEPQYQSVGVIEVKPALKTAEDPEGRRVLPMLSGFIDLQVEYLLSGRVIDIAMSTPTWEPYAEAGTPEETFSRFRDRRSVKNKARSQHILVSFVDPDPNVARAGAQSLIEAYKKLWRSEYRAEDLESIELAKERLRNLETSLFTAGTEIARALEGKGGVDALKLQHMALVKRTLQADEDLDEIRKQKKHAETRNDIPTPDLLDSEIAAQSPRMAEELLQVALMKAREELLAERLTSRNERLVQMRLEIRTRETRIAGLAKAWNRARAAERGGETSIRQLQAREGALRSHHDALEAEALLLAKDREKITLRESEIKVLNGKKEQEEALIATLAAELALVGGRVRVTEIVRLPKVPYKDARLVTAAGGGLLGGFLGLLLVLLLGLSDRSLKSTRDIDHGMADTKLLGIVPVLPSDLSDPEAAELAIHCVHHIRTLLQIGCACDRGASICVTGPSPGSGKTTLATALALSFASSGSRTLLIDCDLVGHGLTDLMGRLLWSDVQRKTRAGGALVVSSADASATQPAPGSVQGALDPLVSPRSMLQRPGPEQLRDELSEAIGRVGLREARDSGVLGKLFALADLVCRGEGREQLEACLMTELASAGEPVSGTPKDWIPPEIQEVARRRTALNGGSLESYLYPTSMDTLHLMPLRGLGHGGDVSVATISRILDRVRGEFDTVLIDTGPVPGTLETPMVATHADAVVMVVSQGDQREDAERAIAHIEEVGGRVSGVVFNRAGQRDVYKASLSMSRASMRSGAQ